MRSSARNRTGFSLLEVLVAVGVAAVGLLAIFQMFPMGFGASAKSSARVIASSIAAEKLAAARTAVHQDITNYRDYVNDLNTNPWQQSDLNNQYWYRIIASEVVDPSLRYAGLSTEDTSPDFYGNLLSLVRLTAYVRGPFTDYEHFKLAEDEDGNFKQLARGGWTDENGVYHEGTYGPAIEVRLPTYVANQHLGDTTLAVAVPAQITDTSDPDYYTNKAARQTIYVTSAANFTVLNAVQITGASAGYYMTPEDDGGATDTGPRDLVHLNDGYYGLTDAGRDIKGMDNVWIGTDMALLDQSGTDLNNESESNKIVQVIPPINTASTDPTQKYPRIVLARPLRTKIASTDAKGKPTYEGYPAGTNVRSRVTLKGNIPAGD